MYDSATQVCIVVELDQDITITKIDVTADQNPATEFDMDLMWADAYIGKANAATVNTVNTAAGATSFTSFIDGTIAKGKCIYLHFGGDPDSEVEQIAFDIRYDFDDN